MRCKTPQQADKILAAAALLFSSHRFHEARMEDIAAQAEVGKGTLYRYFKDKEELYLALLARAAEGLQKRLRGALEKAGSTRDKLSAVVGALLGYFDEQPHVLDVIMHAEAMQRPGQEFPWQKIRHQTNTLVEDILKAGNREGVFAVDDTHLATLMLLGGLRAVLRFGVRPRPDDLPEKLVASFLGGYAGAAERPQPAPVRCAAAPRRAPAGLEALA